MPKLLMTLSAALALFSMCLGNQVRAGMPVIDASNLSENLMMRIMSIQQWLEDNTNQLDQLGELSANLRLDEERFALDAKNYLMPNTGVWEETQKLSENTLALVSAASDLWGEFASLNAYLESFQKSSAWEQCFTQGRCDFAGYLTSLDDQSIETARIAMQNAEAMQYKLKRDADLIHDLMRQARHSEGVGDTLDTLSKISSMTTGSLMDLNAQMTQLITLIGSESAKAANQNHVVEENKESFYGGPVPYQRDFDFDLQGWVEGRTP